MAPKLWDGRDDVQALIQSGRMVFQGADFFDPQPDTYPGGASRQKAAVFLLTRILLNWDDEACVRLVIPDFSPHSRT